MLRRDRVYRLVRSIPAGRVATYGQIASLAGSPRHSRMVGRMLRELPEALETPWHRVVSAGGRIAPRASESHLPQRALLEAEGVRFTTSGRVDMKRHQWEE
jgi:methylated-DNA-protein-cysteine methyltransferase related protein